MTTIEKHAGSNLSISAEQTGFTDVQLAALQNLGVATNSRAEVEMFFHQAKASGLDPFKREIYMITRKGKPTIQTGIDGFYKIADRVSRKTGGTWGIPETYWCGDDGQWVDVWLSPKAPAAAKVVVERDGSRFTTVATTAEYMAEGPLWKKMPARMIAKCAEALAIRRAFPDDLSGLHTSEEMAQADAPVHQPNQRELREPAGQQVPRPAFQTRQAAPSGRAWEEELNSCTTLAEVNALKKQVPPHEQSPRLGKLFADVTQALANAETGELIEGDVA